MAENREVFPGDEVAIEEEYLASEGTFAKNGIVYASQIGTLVLDDDECIAKVVSPNPPNILKPGDIVYAKVGEIRHNGFTWKMALQEKLLARHMVLGMAHMVLVEVHLVNEEHRLSVREILFDFVSVHILNFRFKISNLRLFDFPYRQASIMSTEAQGVGDGDV